MAPMGSVFQWEDDEGRKENGGEIGLTHKSSRREEERNPLLMM